MNFVTVFDVMSHRGLTAARAASVFLLVVVSSGLLWLPHCLVLFAALGHWWPPWGFACSLSPPSPGRIHFPNGPGVF